MLLPAPRLGSSSLAPPALPRTCPSRRDALFPLGSKLTHTCGAPNTRYSCSYPPAAAAAAAGSIGGGGRGVHVALRDIDAGELLTTSYLAWPELLMSTAARYGRRMAYVRVIGAVRQ